jgi:hypothetical protein
VKLTNYLSLLQRLGTCGNKSALPPYAFTSWCVIKRRDNFTFHILTLRRKGTIAWAKLWQHCFLLPYICISEGCRDGAISIQTGYGPRVRSSSSGRGKIYLICISYRLVPDAPNILANGYRVLFPRWLIGRGSKLTTHLQLMPR